MNPSRKTFFRQRIPIVCFLAGYLLFAAFKHKDYGIGWDEYIVYMGGYWLYQDITGHPQAILRDDSEAPGSPHYDQLYPLGLYAVNQRDPGFTYPTWFSRDQFWSRVMNRFYLFV